MRTVRRRVLPVLITILVVLVLVTVAFLVWAHMVMPGERAASLKAWRDPAISITTTSHSIVMTPTSGGRDTGLVFIPGAKVDPSAYLYKLSGIVERGVTVVITKPTLNLAFFDQRPLSTFEADAPGISRWFVGGHSLGGVRACQLADSADVAGLILFGSYCATDLSNNDLTVLSIAGSRDGLSTPAKIAAARHLLPTDATLVEINGANHARFGDYGPQPGDNTATISSAAVRAVITREVLATIAPQG